MTIATPIDGTISLHSHAGCTFQTLRRPGELPGVYRLVRIRIGLTDAAGTVPAMG
jgi:hypothetical protein